MTDTFVVDLKDICHMLNSYYASKPNRNLFIRLYHHDVIISSVLYNTIPMPNVLINIVDEYAINTWYIQYDVHVDRIDIMAKNIVISNTSLTFGFELKLNKVSKDKTNDGVCFNMELLNNMNDHYLKAKNVVNDKYVISCFAEYMKHVHNVKHLFEKIHPWYPIDTDIYAYSTLFRKKRRLIIIGHNNYEYIIKNRRIMSETVLVMKYLLESIVHVMQIKSGTYYL